MKEKELRLGMVFFGGVSLAIYQHGINREILNLVRASKAYNELDGPEAKQAPGHVYAATERGRLEPPCTEDVYFDLLKAIGATVDLRVVVDVIAGSSAGAINGLALARALGHDLSLKPLSEMWLTEADMVSLLAPEARAGAWSKWYFRPFLNPILKRLSKLGVLPGADGSEVQQRLSVFLRSRWFKPPLDGRKLSTLLLDGFAAMGSSADGRQCLLPAGQRLDVSITVTDFYGADRAIVTHDPPVVHDREHRHLMHFSLRRLSSDRTVSDFDDASVASLAFAGRASASYPGAFPPAQIAEIDSLLDERGETWPTRQKFLDLNFGHYREIGRKPEDAVLVDGSILNNKPISAAVDSIRSHGAYREVDRRLVYIDPRPYKLPRGLSPAAPSFFATLRGALSDLPRHEPVYDEIAEISRFNEQIRRLKAVIQTVAPQIDHLVETAAGGRLRQRFEAAELRRWRLSSANVMEHAGAVRTAWLRAMLMESVAFLARLISGVCGYHRDSPRARWVERVIEAWAEAGGLFEDVLAEGPRDRTPAFARFIIDFGMDYKRRRLTFVIQAVNDLYARIGEPDMAGVVPKDLDALKQRLYDAVDRLKARSTYEFLDPALQDEARAIFGHAPPAGDPQGPAAARAFAHARADAVSALIAGLERACALDEVNDEADAILSSEAVFRLGPVCRSKILSAYLGFPYWDIVLLPTTSALNLGAGGVAEVLIDRISPEDAGSLRLEGEGPLLQGSTLAGFGGFLSRAARENDYLWGRLHAADRLIDIVGSAAGEARTGLELRRFKRQAFRKIVAAEREHLTASAGLLDRLTSAIDAF